MFTHTSQIPWHCIYFAIWCPVDRSEKSGQNWEDPIKKLMWSHSQAQTQNFPFASYGQVRAQIYLKQKMFKWAARHITESSIHHLGIQMSRSYVWLVENAPRRLCIFSLQGLVCFSWKHRFLQDKPQLLNISETRVDHEFAQVKPRNPRTQHAVQLGALD